MKTCSKCQESKPLDAFYKNSRSKDGRQNNCKVCSNEAKLAWQKSTEKGQAYVKRNREQVKARNPDYWSLYFKTEVGKEALSNASKKRRALKQGAGGSFTRSEFLELCDLYGNTCLSCLAVGAPLEADHVVPLSKGGSNDISNIQPLCKSCNCSKHTATVDYRPF